MRLDPGWLQVRYALEHALDAAFEQSASTCIEFDSVLSLDEFQRLGYLRNFPHLACLCGRISSDMADELSRGDTELDHEAALPGVNFGLLPATCFKAYIELENTRLDAPRHISCIAKCFRNEDKPLDDYRGFSFTMKEFVCIGPTDLTQAHADAGLDKVSAFLTRLGIAHQVETASDPFFDGSSSQAILSRLIPTKREILFEGNAVSSVNIHRNYFGEKFNITMDGDFATTSCVAFGLERWLQMLKDTFKTPDRALSALDGANQLIRS